MSDELIELLEADLKGFTGQGGEYYWFDGDTVLENYQRAIATIETLQEKLKTAEKWDVIESQRNEKLQARIAELEGMQTIADDNLKAAADKASITYMGCDTPDALAERIAELEGCMETPRIEDLERIAELEERLKEYESV